MPKDWFERGQADIESAELLLVHGGDTAVIAMHIQQAVEKYLKGYLLSKGWKLKRTHDLAELLNDAIDYASKFEEFRSFCDEATAYYFESRYPMFAEGPTKEDVESAFNNAKEIISMIAHEAKSSGAHDVG
ncbi:MAG: HEPN domain-containing protein [Candidatus Thermoplasmatota archaeon]